MLAVINKERYIFPWHDSSHLKHLSASFGRR